MSGPWDKYAQQGAPTAVPAMAPAGAPNAGDPVIAPPDPYKQAAEQRAQQDQVMQQQAAARDAERLRMAQQQTSQDTVKLTESQGKAAGMLKRAIDATNQFEALKIGPRSYAGQKIANSAPDFKNLTDSPDRQQAVAFQRDFISAVLRVESGAAVSQSEFDNYSKLYFPQPGDTPETLDAKAIERRHALEALQLQAGAEGKNLAIPPVPTSDASPTSDKSKPWTAQMAAAKWGAGVLDDKGNPLGPDGGSGYDAKGNSLGFFGETTDTSPTPEQQAAQTEAARLDKTIGKAGYGDLAAHGLTFGLTDEATGVGRALGRLLKGDTNIAQNYATGRDAETLRLQDARSRLTGGTATEMLGGFALPANALAGGLGAAAKGGALAGAVGGFGYGRGYDQSTQNALIGGVAGGVLGYGGQRIGNALAARAASDVPERAAALSAAGQAEGVTVNRAMVDPRLQNRVTGVDATITAGPVVQRGMAKIEGQIGSRVQDLGHGGNPMNEVTGGQTVEAAGKRFIEKSGQSATRKYQRAEQLAGNAKVEPKESLAAVDGMIATLSETPGQNSAEIGFLNTLKDDLSQNLSVGALRRMRTALRKRISNGNLTFGEDEGRVLGIMDAAANDIRSGLTAQGNVKAAQAFDAADKSYRARMEYISGTLQKIMGKRNTNLPAEKMWQRFEAMASAKGDAVGLKKFYATLTPEEQADAAATIADHLGKDNSGEFSVAHFLSQSEKLSDSATRTIFGADGAESVKNLRLLGKEVKRVTSAMNSRTSKTGVANNYKDWLLNLTLGSIAGGGGGLAGGSGAAMAGAGAALSLNAARNAITARTLMSPKLTRWLLQAPRSAAPAAIDRHFERLGEIAKAEPALAGEIDSLRKAIMGAANDNVGVSAAAGNRKEDQKQQ